MAFRMRFEKTAGWRSALTMTGLLLLPSKEVRTRADVPKPPLHDIIRDTARRHGIKPRVLEGLVAAESSFRPHVVNLKDGRTSAHQSVGLTQIKPSTARSVGYKGPIERLKQPDVNVEMGARYLKKQLARYGGDYSRALSAYNAGRAVESNKQYVRKILTYRPKRR